MTPSRSILPLITEKEAELRRRIEAAHAQAEAQLQAAQSVAKQLLIQAEQEARQEAELLYRQGIEAAKQEAESIVTAAQERAARQEQQTAANLLEVALHIVELVLPAEFSSATTKSAEAQPDNRTLTGGD